MLHASSSRAAVVVWDAADPNDCMPVRRSTRSSPPHSSMDHTFFDFWAAKLSWEDADIIEMIASGVEGRSDCERATVLMMHHKGVREKYTVVAAAVDADTAADRQWVSAPTLHLPYVPCRLVPKNVAEKR